MAFQRMERGAAPRVRRPVHQPAGTERGVWRALGALTLHTQRSHILYSGELTPRMHALVCGPLPRMHRHTGTGVHRAFTEPATGRPSMGDVGKWNAKKYKPHTY